MAAVAVLVWGVTFVNTKALLVSFSALEIQVLRFAIAYAALWAIRPSFDRVEKGDEKLFALMGLAGVAVYQLLENCAIHYTNASNVAILVSICPVATALMVRAFGGGRRLSAMFFGGFAVAISGVACVSLNGIREFHFRPAGDLMALAAMLSWAVYSALVSKCAEKTYAQAFVIRRMFFWTLVFTAPVVAFGSTPLGRAVADGSLAVTWDAAANAARFSDAMNWVNLGFLGVLASALCFVLWNAACGLLGVVRCTVGLYLVPVVTVAFAYVFLGEKMTALSATGAALTLAGVVMSGWKRNRGA